MTQMARYAVRNGLRARNVGTCIKPRKVPMSGPLPREIANAVGDSDMGCA